jgi:hypothetical protein
MWSRNAEHGPGEQTFACDFLGERAVCAKGNFVKGHLEGEGTWRLHKSGHIIFNGTFEEGIIKQGQSL